MRTFLLTFLGGLAALVMFFVLIPLMLLMSFLPSGEPQRVPNAVVEVDLRRSWPDQPAADALSAATLAAQPPAAKQGYLLGYVSTGIKQFTFEYATTCGGLERGYSR
jgi:hypothetical protein